MDKRVKQGIVTAAVAAGMLTNAAADDAAELLSGAEPPQDGHVMIVAAGEMPDYAVYLDEDEELWGMDRVRAWMLKLPLAVRALVLLPLWAVGEVCFAAAGVLSAGLATAPGQFLLSLAAQLGLLLGIFALTYKLIFPHTPVRQLLGKTRFPWLLGAAFAVSVADFALSMTVEQWPLLRLALLAMAGFGVLSLLWARLCSHLKGPERRRKRLEYTFEP
ncbi:MAG: hypothetical protein ACI3W8_01755 [Oscillospiraceae bacterium]